MGWGVTYPSPHGREEIDDRYECEGHRCTNLIEPGEEHACAINACHRDTLCDGCAFDCADCNQIFCREHILVHEQADRFATYRCYACDRKRQQAAA
jgi:hypothetical protein